MKKMLVGLCALLAVGTAQANPYYYYPGAQARAAAPSQTATPDALLKQGLAAMSTYLNAGSKASPAQMQAFLNTKIAPYFDFDYMAKWAAGRIYKRMNATQRQQLAAKLQDMFFTALSRNLGAKSYVKPRIEISRTSTRPYSRESTVNVVVTPRSGYPVKLSFRFYKSTAGWKVFDVTANGTSAVMYYRKTFNKMMQRGGMQSLTK